jgi:hypothetical protein
MKFYYDVIESYEIDIDFQDIYDYIKSDLPSYSNYAIYEHFISNVECILTAVYGCNDFVEFDNEGNVDNMLNYWEQWFDKQFGEGWDEI